ncbi:MAG: transcriptional regulator, ArsR family [Bryobacterales bacterium]|nr:transcriptional regulator, ArsR family [Bryobacterales bacterium]
MGKALASGRRLELLDLLAQTERTVEDLARETAQPISNTSQHLQVLREARLVEIRRDGNYIHYRLADESVLRTWLSIRDLAGTRLAEIDRIGSSFMKNRPALEPITADELKRRLKAVVVLDVRPQDEYAAGHVPAARSIPIAELKKRIGELPRRGEIVAYCRGPYCMLADEAVTFLRDRGYKAVRLAQGFPEWKAKGFPIESHLTKLPSRQDLAPTVRLKSLTRH